LKWLILVALILLTPISFMLGRRRRFAGSYQWADALGENIPLPEEVSGQVGSEVCASPDGQIIVVAGNRIIPQDVFTGKKKDPALVLRCYKYFICVSKTFGKGFEGVCRSPSPGVVTSMALSPTHPNRLAFIAAEFQVIVPESEAELYRMAQDPKMRETLAEEYATALQLKDLRVAVYILDIENNAPPKMICTLDNYSQEAERGTRVADLDLSQMNPSHVKLLHEMDSVKKFGRFDHWQMRLRREKEMKSITWTSDGNGFLVSDGYSLTKVDLSGTKTPFYAPDDVLVSSNIHCCANGDVLFLEANLSGQGDDRYYYLTRLDKDGKAVSKTKVSRFYRGSLAFDEAMFVLVGENKMAIIYNKPENMHDAFVRTVSFPPYTDDWRDRSQQYDIHDPNRVQFYYLSKAFINNGEEVLLFKRRVHAYGPRGFPNWEATPWAPENAAAPWVELRKMKIRAY
jgi:hypothetical protein